MAAQTMSGREEIPTRHRVQLDFSSQAYERLGQLRHKAEAPSNAAVVRDALRLYEWFLEVKAKKGKIQVVEGDEVREIEFIF